ncbi:hypothetical protein ACFFX0_22080 [Citricoccus parietis]|uniref:Uncharacterized protein n=1 Tax=Citricoccus parietis TaxID=592307 RepID=A0ABV5G482_9MICC
MREISRPRAGTETPQKRTLPRLGVCPAPRPWSDVTCPMSARQTS